MELDISLLKPGGKQVTVTQTRYQYFPARFVWGKQQLEVDAVRRCWTSLRRDLAGRPNEYHHFRVRTTQGTFVLTYDLRRDRWTATPDTQPGNRAA